ncbi:unnamed protein product [Paramecium pentaurelia]|uniref:Uncharacterized protein n=1 Tax=Paramecium pentaurelia TaxID=43138 RepID=A0A8S1YIN5_9CILI|nr:unnamed protein product [Paramecium pentaurelia]
MRNFSIKITHESQFFEISSILQNLFTTIYMSRMLECYKYQESWFYMQILYKNILLFPYKKYTKRFQQMSCVFLVHYKISIIGKLENWLVILLRELKSEYEKGYYEDNNNFYNSLSVNAMINQITIIKIWHTIICSFCDSSQLLIQRNCQPKFELRYNYIKNVKMVIILQMIYANLANFKVQTFLDLKLTFYFTLSKCLFEYHIFS